MQDKTRPSKRLRANPELCEKWNEILNLHWIYSDVFYQLLEDKRKMQDDPTLGFYPSFDSKSLPEIEPPLNSPIHFGEEPQIELNPRFSKLI